jgi:hypothetical protein
VVVDTRNPPQPTRALTELDETMIRSLARQLAVRRLGPADERVEALAKQIARHVLTYGQGPR